MNLPIFTEPIDRKPVNPHALEIAKANLALNSFVGMSDDFDELADLYPILVGLEDDLAKVIGLIHEKVKTMREGRYESRDLGRTSQSADHWAKAQMAEWARRAARS